MYGKTDGVDYVGTLWLIFWPPHPCTHLEYQIPHCSLFKLPLPNNFYKIYTKCVQELYKTPNLYIFCAQRLYKSKFCIIMNVRKCTSNFYIYGKIVQPVRKLYEARTKNRLKLKMYVLCTYKKCANYTKCIQMLMESHMLLLMYFLLYKEPLHFCFLNFFINNSTIFRSILQRRKISEPIVHTQKIPRWIYMKDSFSINLIYYNYNICYNVWSIFS